MSEKIIWTLIFILAPALILYGAYKIKFLGKIGGVILSYALGLILGNSGLIPDSVLPIQKSIVTISIPLALPMLLYSIDIKKFKSLAGRTIVSMLLAMVALFIVIVTGYLMFKNHIPDDWKIAGLLVGVYTGGTPNLASIKEVLQVDTETYILVHTADTIMGIIFLMFVLPLGQRALGLILPKFSDTKRKHSAEEEQLLIEKFDDSPKAYADILKKENIFQVAKAFGLTLIIASVSLGIATLVASDGGFEAVAILSITTLAILASLNKKVRNLKKSFQAGMYLILIFSFTVASMAKFERFAQSSPYIFYYVAWAVTMTFILHVLLSAIFRIDTDTTLITSTALIMSPPFVPVVASALKNKYIILSGLTVGIIGYGVGNYLGVLVAYLLKTL